MARKEFACALSTDKDWGKAVAAACEKVRQDLRGGCDLALLFVAELYPAVAPSALPKMVQDSLGASILLGCNGVGVIAGSREVEKSPGVSLMGMRLPGAKLTPFYLSAEPSQAVEKPSELFELLDLYPTDKPKFLALADPMSCDIENLVQVFNEAYPKAPVIGGLSSGPALGKPSWLLLNSEFYTSGCVGVALSGEVRFATAVAQGCRPIGTPLTITKAEGRILYELGGRPPFDIARELLQSVPSQDRDVAAHSLFAGLLMDERRSRFRRGDFLIRNLGGFDPKSGAMMIGSALRVGQTFQFQLRDAEASERELRAILEGLPGREGARGAFLVNCAGRGQGLYKKPDHDVGLVQALKGPIPLAGFFAGGEIGPVGDKNYVHGYTSSLAIIS
ncbi:MAG: FIST C-terminal domain-containing protein [Elusimicrobia bacterium]|nr:FIST C-terminal domain-containing protein [Elusimicrobiota bacterium]